MVYHCVCALLCGSTLRLKRIAIFLKLPFFWRRVYTNEYGVMQISYDPRLHDPDPGPLEKSRKKSCVSFQTSSESVPVKLNLTFLSFEIHIQKNLNQFKSILAHMVLWSNGKPMTMQHCYESIKKSTTRLVQTLDEYESQIKWISNELPRAVLAKYIGLAKLPWINETP